MRTTIILLVGILLSFYTIVGAENTEMPTEGIYPNNYAGWLYCDFNITHEPIGNVTKGGTGFSLDFGVNIGKLFHKSIMITPLAGLSILWGEKYNDTFHKDFVKHYQKSSKLQEYENRQRESAENLDSGNPLSEEERAEYNALEKGEKVSEYIRNKEIEGNVVKFYYGVIIRYPHKYFPPVKIYRLLCWNYIKELSSGFYTVYSDGSTGSSKTIHSLDRTGWGIEVFIFRGYTLFSDESLGQFNIGSVSLFIEFFNFNEATITDENTSAYGSTEREVKISEFADQAFNDQYQTEIKFGIKIGMNIM